MYKAMQKIALFGIIIVIGLGLGSWWILRPRPVVVEESATPSPVTVPGCPEVNFAQAPLRLNGQDLLVAVAQNVGERTHGLSHCQALPANSGMYFILPQKDRAIFWMKDMLLPIDIVWIADGQVVGIESNVLPPAGQIADQDLPRYMAPVAVDAVLELPAGKSQTYGITNGTPVELGTENRAASN